VVVQVPHTLPLLRSVERHVGHKSRPQTKGAVALSINEPLSRVGASPPPTSLHVALLVSNTLIRHLHPVHLRVEQTAATTHAPLPHPAQIRLAVRRARRRAARELGLPLRI